MEKMNEKGSFGQEHYESPIKYKQCPICNSGMEIFKQDGNRPVIHCPVCQSKGIGYIWLYGDKWLIDNSVENNAKPQPSLFG